MDCSPFSQTETLIFWGLAMFFGFTTFWFWALWFERPRHDPSHYIKKAGKIVQSGDVMKTDDGKLVAVDHFYRNFLGRIRAKVSYFDHEKQIWAQKTYAPSRLIFIRKNSNIEYALRTTSGEYMLGLLGYQSL